MSFPVRFHALAQTAFFLLFRETRRMEAEKTARVLWKGGRGCAVLMRAPAPRANSEFLKK